MKTARNGLEVVGYRFRSAAGNFFIVETTGLGKAKRIAGPTATFVGRA